MAILIGAKAGNGATAAAARQGSTWSTPVAVGAGYGFRMLSEGIQGGKSALERATLGFVFGDKPDVGAESWRGPVSCNLFYGGNCGFLASTAFGTSGTPTTSGSIATHTVDLANGLAKFYTLCLARRTNVGDSTKWHEYDSCVTERVTFRGAGQDRVTMELGILANTLDRASTTNTTAQTDAVTVPTITDAVRFRDGLFRINAQAGSALTSTTDDVGIAGFELSIVRQLSTDFLADGTGEMAQPNETDVSMVRLAIDLRSYDSDTWKTAWAAGTEYKADLKFTGRSYVAGSTYPSYHFKFPRLVLTGEPQANISGRGRTTHRVEFAGLVASSAPTGMTGITQPVRLVVVDGVSSAYLA